MTCRHCGARLELVLVDLGSAPPSNAYLTTDQLGQPEPRYPLRVLVCETCWLVQTQDFAKPEQLFDSSYAYFSGYSRTWLDHVESYVANMVERLSLHSRSRVIEVASNDGHLLHYVQARGIPSLGIEPTASTAAAARERGIEVIEDFFGTRLADTLAADAPADLMIANNVLAHVPDINDFVAGFSRLLKPTGVATFEFAYVRRLIDETQFDTIYHEHFSYLSMTAVDRVFLTNGLVAFDVEEIPTHGGSLRVYAQRADVGRRPRAAAVDLMLEREAEAGMTGVDFYRGFQGKAERVRDDLVSFLDVALELGKSVAAYGAAAKGNTLLNFACIRAPSIRFVVDANPAKQGKYLPGSHVPIGPEALLREERPNYVLILPWNLKEEVLMQLRYVRDWGGRFAIAVPRLEVMD